MEAEQIFKGWSLVGVLSINEGVPAKGIVGFLPFFFFFLKSWLELKKLLRHTQWLGYVSSSRGTDYTW